MSLKNKHEKIINKIDKQCLYITYNHTYIDGGGDLRLFGVWVLEHVPTLIYLVWQSYVRLEILSDNITIKYGCMYWIKSFLELFTHVFRGESLHN